MKSKRRFTHIFRKDNTICNNSDNRRGNDSYRLKCQELKFFSKNETGCWEEFLEFVFKVSCKLLILSLKLEVVNVYFNCPQKKMQYGRIQWLGPHSRECSFAERRQKISRYLLKKKALYLLDSPRPASQHLAESYYESFRLKLIMCICSSVHSDLHHILNHLKCRFTITAFVSTVSLHCEQG